MGTEDVLLLCRLPPNSLVERYFDAYGGWSNRAYFRTCMAPIIRDQLGYTFDEGSHTMDAHATATLSLWYAYAAACIKKEGRFPYSWDVADNVFVLPDKQDNEDFWESFIDALMLRAKTMKRAYNV